MDAERNVGVAGVGVGAGLIVYGAIVLSVWRCIFMDALRLI